MGLVRTPKWGGTIARRTRAGDPGRSGHLEPGSRGMKIGIGWLVLASVSCLAAGCRHEAPASAWIQGGDDARWATAARHLRGLDVAMVEMGHRHQELYWAGEDANWAYAEYQVAKLELSLENALERRPKRRASAEASFLPQLAELGRAVSARDGGEFEGAFVRLTSACNACHAAEGVASFHVDVPSERRTLIHMAR
jgi:hypothetical protein